MSERTRQIVRFMLAALLCLPVLVRADVFVRDDIILDPTPQRFSVCHGHTCAFVSEVGLTPEEWAEVKDSFKPCAVSPFAEQGQIRIAIAKMERLVGTAIGTSADRGRNEANDVGLHAKMDCIDESTNTTIYLTLFKRQGLLRHHDVLDRSTRGWFFLGMPHTTAVIRNHADGSLWAVDSWFLNNGEPPFIVPLGVWRRGWKPGKPMVVVEE